VQGQALMLSKPQSEIEEDKIMRAQNHGCGDHE
jgi:hypothetical protein